MRVMGSVVKIFEVHAFDKIVPFPDVIKSAIGFLVWCAGQIGRASCRERV